MGHSCRRSVILMNAVINMLSIEEVPRIRQFSGGRSGRFVALLFGSVAVAVLTGTIAHVFDEMAALLLLSLLLLLAVFIGNFRYGILIPVVLLPLGSTTLIPREMFGVTGFNPLNGALLLSVLSLCLIWMVQPGRLSFPKWSGQFWVYVAMMVLGAFHGAMHVQAIPEYFRVLQVIKFDSIGGYLQDTFFKQMLILVTAFVFAIAVRNAHRPAGCLVSIFASTLVLPVAVISIVAMSGESLASLASSDSRAFLSVVGMHANELGLLFNMMFALSLFCFISVSGAREKWALGLISLVLTVAIALTFSRGAYLGFLVVVMFLQFTQRRFRTTALISLVGVVGAMLMPDAMIDRAFSGLEHGNADDISAGRVTGIWRPLIEDIVSSPIIGGGRSSILWSEAAREQRILPVGHPHSAYIAAVLDYGLLGVVIITSFFWHMWRVFKTMAELSIEPIWRGFFKGAMACILLLLVQGLTDDIFTPSSTQPFLWLAYGASVGLISRVNAQTKGASFAVQT